MDTDQERRFVRRLKSRDEKAFTELVRLNQSSVFNLVLRMLGNRAEAEDVAQEVFVSVFRHIHRFREDSRLSTWLYRVASNHCKNRLKYLCRRRMWRTASIDSVSEGEVYAHGIQERVPPPDLVLQGRQMESAVQRAISELQEDHRLLIILRDIQALSYEEIGEIAALPLGTVKSRLHRARLALKEKIKPWLK